MYKNKKILFSISSVIVILATTTMAHAHGNSSSETNTSNQSRQYLSLKEETSPIQISLQDLQSLYANTFIGGKAKVFIPSYFQSSFYVHFQDHGGNHLGKALLSFRDGPRKWDLNIAQLFLNRHESRGSGLAARFLQATTRLLQRITQDTDAVISLYAFTGYTTYSGREYGGYIWAPYGFDYETTDEKEAKLCGLSESDQISAQIQFKKWLIKNHQQDLTQNELEKIMNSVSQWRYPWQMGLYDVSSDIGRKLGRFDGRLGKDFMSDEKEDFRWLGVLYVNQPNSPGMIQFKKYSNGVISKTRPRELKHSF